MLDNDASLNGLGELSEIVRREAIEATDTGRAAAAVGVLLQLDAFAFSPENQRSDSLLEALKKKDLATLSPAPAVQCSSRRSVTAAP